MDGFARCAPLGQSAGEAWWAQDGWEWEDWVHKRGVMYAWISYSNANNPTNSAQCRAGLFRHDVLTNTWTRVANWPEYLGGYYRNMNLLTNGDDILCIYAGSVWRLVEPIDEVNYPTGWELISKEPHRILTSGDVFGYSNLACMNGGGGRENQSGIFGMGSNPVTEYIGDTIFAVFYSRDFGICNDKFAKFSTESGTWTFQDLPTLPNDGRPADIAITDKMGGLFQLFVLDRDGAFPVAQGVVNANNSKYNGGTTEYVGEDSLKYIYVFDPRDNSWKDISRGPNYTNLTGGNWIPTPTNIVTSWDLLRYLSNYYL
jgi:hypothetical protein